jgi:hypothetical protein
MNNLLLRRAPEHRPPAEGLDDYDVIGTEGMIIRRIFKVATSPAGTPWMWTLSYGGRSGAHVHARLRTNVRGGHGGVRQELAEGVGHGKGAHEAKRNRSQHGQVIANSSCGRGPLPEAHDW